MATPKQSGPQPRWSGIVAIWLGVALFDASQTVFTMRSQGMHHAWALLFVTVVLSWLPWTLATPLVVQLGRRCPPVRLRPLSAWSLHIGMAASICLVSAAWVGLLESLLNPWAYPTPAPFHEIFLPKCYSGILSSMVLYAFIVTITLVLDSKERLVLQETETAHLNEQLSKAQLNALRRQIEPHFLFNTLNAIAGLVREQRNDAAVTMIVGLSDFLRHVADGSNRQQVPLKEEMEFVQRYLEIQKVRFAERLQLSMDVPAELLLANVPSFVLQPLVENAIKHGTAKQAHGGAIRIAASRSNGNLNLSVYNDGPGLRDGWETAPSGVGMSNLRARLKGLYSDRFELTMHNEGPAGVEVVVTVPFKEE